MEKYSLIMMNILLPQILQYYPKSNLRSSAITSSHRQLTHLKLFPHITISVISDV